MIAEVAIPKSFGLNDVFDYFIPEDMKPYVCVGNRVFVPFRTSIVFGFVVKLKDKSALQKKLKPIYKNLDCVPIADEKILSLAYKMKSQYFCSLGEAISAILPAGLKRSFKKIDLDYNNVGHRDIPFFSLTGQDVEYSKLPQCEKRCIVVGDSNSSKKWLLYSALIKTTLNSKKSVLFLVPDYQKINSVKNTLGLEIEPYCFSSALTSLESINNWLAVKQAPFSFIIGTRSAIFAPVNNLGLIIIEDESHFAYVQEQTPHYKTRDIAFWRSKLDDSRVVLSSFMPSLESYYLKMASKPSRLGEKAAYISFEPDQPFPAVKIVDMRYDFRYTNREKIVSKIFEYNIAGNLQKNERILIFVNKKGFSTFLYCKKCKKIQSCPRCSSSLTYFFKEKIVSCPICHYQADSFQLCQECKSSYIKFFGYGSEKVESEIKRLFPSAKMAFFDNTTEDIKSLEDYNIIFATPRFLENFECNTYSFDSVYVMSCDEMMGHLDFRSTEKAFMKLIRLGGMAQKYLCVQTRLADHYIFKYLKKFDSEGFYKHELELRKELKLPPYKRMGVLSIRAKNLEKSEKEANEIYQKLEGAVNKKGFFQFSEPVPCVPLKARGNYRFEIFFKYNKPEKINEALNGILKQRRSGVIVTINPDVF